MRLRIIVSQHVWHKTSNDLLKAAKDHAIVFICTKFKLSSETRSPNAVKQKEQSMSEHKIDIFMGPSEIYSNRKVKYEPVSSPKDGSTSIIS